MQVKRLYKNNKAQTNIVAVNILIYWLEGTLIIIAKQIKQNISLERQPLQHWSKNIYLCIIIASIFYKKIVGFIEILSKIVIYNYQQKWRELRVN